MMSAHWILYMLVYVLFMLATGPILLLILCAAVQGRLSGRHMPYPLILPALTGMAWLLCRCCAEQGYDWRGMVWTALLFWARMSFAGCMAGWVISRNFSTKQRKE